jgi:tetratricopeptide (TPR) repeat protein
MFKHASRKSRRLVWLLLAVLSSGSYAFACLQGEEGSPAEISVGKSVQVEGVSASDFAKAFVTHADRAYWERVRALIEKKRPYSRNNMAVALIHVGRVGEAVPMLEEAERKNPGVYVTAANLGTAYELAGDNRKALEWIKEGVRRYGDSHYATEWLHVKILEAKLALENDPQWLTKNSVLGADIRAPEDASRPERPVTDYLGRPKSLEEVESALVYQLHERMEFVRPPDPVVADLLFDLSNLLARTRSAEHAEVVRSMALSYNPGQVEIRLAAQTRPSAGTRPASNDFTRPSLLFAALAGAALLLLTCCLYVLVRRQRVRHRRV